MPPSREAGMMDEAAVIEAEIQLELENINLDDDPNVMEDVGDVGEMAIPEEVQV